MKPKSNQTCRLPLWRRHAVAAAIALTCGPLVSSANASDFTDGQKLFAAKDYRNAAVKFEAAMKTNARDANTVYYCALANQMTNNRARARQLYEYIITSFPSSQVAGMASTALQQLGGAATASGSTSIPSSTQSGGNSPRVARPFNALPPDPDIERCPPEVKVPYTTRNGGVYVDCTLNGKAIRLHLDTGAFSTAVGVNQLTDMGIARTQGRDRLQISGVGSNSTIGAWRETMALAIGPIYQRNALVTVQENMPGEGLLGQSFLGYFDVSIDKANQQVIFRRKSAKTAEIQPRGTIDIPFAVGPGGHLLVTVEFNNKPMVCYFDTGADSVCLTAAQLKQLRVDMPDGPPSGNSTGVSGTVPFWNVTMNKVRLGQIVKEDFTCAVVTQAAMDHPLLGQTFYAGYNYKVDQSKKVIHFSPLN